jgi:hypothetical protein
MVTATVFLSDAPAGLIALIVKRSEPASSDRSESRKRKAGSEHDEAVRRYALAALDRQTKDVELAGKGTRNQALNNGALSLGHLVGAGALTENAVRAALEGACHTNGLIKDDGNASVRATISSGLKAGIAQAADLSKVGQGGRVRGAQPRPSDSPSFERQTAQSQPDRDADELNRRLASFKLTDVGNVERFLAR